MKKFILSLFVLVAVFCTVFNVSQASDKKYTIATVVKIDGIPWFDRMRQGVEEYGKETGHETIFMGPAQADAAQQVQIIENLIAQQVDAICVVPFSPEALEPVLKRARDAGIIVVVHEASDQKNADAIIEAFQNQAYGAQMLKFLAEKMGKKGEYTNFVGSLTSKSHNEWMDGAEAAQQKDYPEMKLVSRRNEDYDDQNKAYEKTKDLLTAYPDLKGVLGSASTTAPGAGLAVEEAGLADQVSVVGTSLPSVCKQYLETGAVDYIAFWDPAMAGKAMNEIAVRILDGKKDQLKDGTDLGIEGYNSIKQDPKKPNLFYGQAWVFVNKDNMDKYNF